MKWCVRKRAGEMCAIWRSIAGLEILFWGGSGRRGQGAGVRSIGERLGGLWVTKLRLGRGRKELGEGHGS